MPQRAWTSLISISQCVLLYVTSWDEYRQILRRHALIHMLGIHSILITLMCDIKRTFVWNYPNKKKCKFGRNGTTKGLGDKFIE